MIKPFPARRTRLWVLPIVAFSLLIVAAGTANAQLGAALQKAPLQRLIVTEPDASQETVFARPEVTRPVAFDVSLPLRDLAAQAPSRRAPLTASQEPIEIRPEPGPEVTYKGHSGDGALQADFRGLEAASAVTIPGTLANFEGFSNQDNFNIFGFRVNPPDSNAAVGPNHVVEIINLVFGVFDKTGNKLLGPVDTGTLWAGFAVPDCTDPSGDPVVLYDKLENRWVLTQFTTRGLSDPTKPFFNCVAVSITGDPTGAYFRYAFETTVNNVFFFPDYPKYGTWTNSYVLTSRDFGPTTQYGISVYALEKAKMIEGNPNARMVHFFLDSAVVPISQIGDGLLPADIDSLNEQPQDGAPIPIVGTMDDGGPYGAPFDALNVYNLSILWEEGNQPIASLKLAAQLSVASFDSIFPCGTVKGLTPPATGRDCLPQPGVAGNQFLDILSYRQRPTYRLAYRNFGPFESLVTNQSVEALPGVAGVRWYEIRRKNGTYSIFQQGTYAPNDGVHRWMGSIAQDAKGDIALGFSVVNGTNVFPGIRYTGRLVGDPLGQLTLGEGTVINGTGVQRTTNSRWGDYTSMQIDPTDDCTFWYLNEYYTAAGQASSTAGWQTRIASFKLPGCGGQ